MKAIKPLLLAAFAGLPLLALPALAQSSTTTTTNSSMGVPQAPTPQQAPAAQGGTDGAGAGESGGSGK